MNDTINMEIPLEDLHDSPSNPRQNYSESYLQELATNLKAVGRILQPLLVRPRMTPLFGNDPDAQIGYEIVFGHRRRRAAELAGFTTAPCMVRQMSDLDVKVAQVSENLQRQDVHPIEEAQGYQVLIDEHNETAERLAEQFGKSRSYVYGRLKLLAACPQVRKACLAGEIGADAALLVARLRSIKLQEKALAEIKKSYHTNLEDGGKGSFRAIRSLLNEKFTLDLAKAPFPTEEEMLVPAAGTCVFCPKRSGNAPEFADIVEDKVDRWGMHLGPDVCTDPDCFAEKKVVFFKREAQALVAQGKTVIDGAKARQAIDTYGRLKDSFVALKELPGGKTSLKAAATKGNTCVPTVVTIQDPRTGKTIEAVKRSDLVAVGLEKVKPKGANGGDGYGSAAWERERKENDAKAAIETKLREAVLDETRDAIAAAPRSDADLRLIALCMVDGCGDGRHKAHVLELWRCKTEVDLLEDIKTMHADDLARLMLDVAICVNVRINGWGLEDQPEALLDAASRYGIDVKRVREAAGEPSAPSTAARAQKGAAASRHGAVKYKDPMTGSTWSGKGLKPKWLQVALADGKALSDFEISTAPTAAQARKGAPAAAAAVPSKQVSVDAGSAGDHDGQAQLELNSEAGQEVDQMVDAGSAGGHIDQVGAPEEAAA